MQTARCDSLAQHELRFSLAPANASVLKFGQTLSDLPPPEPTYTHADGWNYFAQPDQYPGLNHMLTSRSCNPLWEFPKFSHETNSHQTQNLHMPVDARALPSSLPPLFQPIYELDVVSCPTESAPQT